MADGCHPKEGSKERKSKADHACRRSEVNSESRHYELYLGATFDDRTDSINVVTCSITFLTDSDI